MKHEKLYQIQAKARRYERLSCLIILVGILLILSFALLMLLEITNNLSSAYLLLLCCIVLMIVGTIFGRLEARQYRIAETYFILKVMDLVKDFGISSDNFEIIHEISGIYWIGFHNQIVDYDKLQSMLDEEITIMNKIMKSNIRCKLI